MTMKIICVVSDLFESKIIEYSTFNLNEMTESECLSEFRFGKRDIPMRYLFSI